MRGTSDIALRPGVAGLVDRARMAVLRRAYAEAMAQLPEAARAAHESTA